MILFLPEFPLAVAAESFPLEASQFFDRILNLSVGRFIIPYIAILAAQPEGRSGSRPFCPLHVSHKIIELVAMCSGVIRLARLFEAPSTCALR